MDDHAGGVDRPSQPRLSRRCEFQLHAPDEVARIGAGLDFFARACES